MREIDILIKAKNGDKKSKEEIIKKYKPIVYKFSLNYFIVGDTDEDLRQRGYEYVLRAIDMYDIEKGASFPAYIKNALTNNYNVLVRDTMKLKATGSLNTTNDEGFEILELIESDENVEEQIIMSESMNELKAALNKLSEEDRQFILFIHGKNSGAISEYSRMKGISYKKCIRMRDKIMTQLRREILKN